MADTKPTHGTHGTLPPVEGDGISYSGIVWFVVILTVTTLVCQLLMWILLGAMKSQAPDAATLPSPLAPAADHAAQGGRVYPDMVAIGQPNGPAPALLVREPVNLDALRAHEHEALTTYGWVDKNAGTYRIPIERAKELLIERGLPVRGSEGAKDVKAVKEAKK